MFENVILLSLMVVLIYLAGVYAKNIFLTLLSGAMFIVIGAYTLIYDVGFASFNPVIASFFVVLGFGILITEVVRI